MSHFHTGFLPAVPDKVWKSDWRIGLEDKLRTPLPKYWKAEDVAPRQPKPEKVPRVAKVKEPKVKKERPPVVVEERRLCPGCGNKLNRQNRRGRCRKCVSRRKEERRLCPGCGNKLNQQNRRGRCRKCVSRRKDGRIDVERKQPSRPAHVVRTKFCSGCGKGLNKQNRIGMCKKCCPQMRMSDMIPKSTCVECGRVTNRRNDFDRCTKHSRPFYRKAWREKNAGRVAA